MKSTSINCRFRSLIPITFLTGFYVSQVVSRYWDQFMSLPWPDRLALKLVSYIPGKARRTINSRCKSRWYRSSLILIFFRLRTQDTFRRNLRRTVMRYVNLSIVLVFRLVSCKVHKRFPTYQSMIDAKLMLPLEAKRLQKIDEKTPHESTWAPVRLGANNQFTRFIHSDDHAPFYNFGALIS